MQEIITSIDFENKSYDQLVEIENKVKEYKQKSLSRRVTELEDFKLKFFKIIKELKNENKEKDEIITDLNGRIEDIEDKTNILSYDDSKFRDLKKAVKSRIFHLVGKKESIKYILFYDSFIRKLYSDICSSLNASKVGKIKIDDFEVAIVLVKRWLPTRKYIESKLTEYQKLSEKKKKTEKELKKINALEEYLDKTEGGVYIDF